MIGAVLIVIVLVIAIPVGVMMSGGAFAAVLGWALKDNAAAEHADSELLDTNY
jgi:hypothetical protein